MTINFKVPSDFIVDDIINRSKIFPYLGKYLLPFQHERFQEAPIEDIDVSVTDLSFLVSSLS